MTAPGISLIIPFYNSSRYMRQAIDSALNQTVAPTQIIAVDDGSTDDSQAIARSYGNAVTVIAKPNGGGASARNFGLKAADRPLIAFLDADDRLMPEKLERELDALADHAEALLCLCRVRAFWSPEVPERKRHPVDVTPQFRPGQPTSWLARRELFERAGNFNVTDAFRLTDGSELFLRIEKANCPVVRIEDALVEHRLHASNQTADSRAHRDAIMNLMKRRLDLRRCSS